MPALYQSTLLARRLAAVVALTLLSASAAWAAPLGVAEAVRSGRAVAVRDMGGAPGDVIAALKVDLKAHKGKDVAKTQAELDRFADTSDGATLAYIASEDPVAKGPKDSPPVGTAYWGIQRRTPDGMARDMMLLRDGKLSFGAPHPAPADDRKRKPSDGS